MSKTRNGDGVATSSTPINTPKEIVSSFENLYKAMLRCKRNVMWKDSVAGFVKNGAMNCYKLRQELMDGTYHLSGYSIFEVHEKKTRTIVSTRFRDRVVQRSLCDNYLYHELTKGFIYDNCACLIGKGTDFARNRLKCHLQRHYRKHKLKGWVLKLDIHDYFGSTLHGVAKEAVDKRVPDEWAKSMVYDIIDSFNHIAPDRGMGLGSQVTQLVELAVLDDIDHAIKEKMHIKGYVRYMDDLILIHEDKAYLQKCLEEIKSMLADIGLEVNDKKTTIQPLKHSISFLGFRFNLTDTGKVIMRLQTGKASKERRRLKKMSHLDNFKDCYMSWRAYVSKGNTYRVLCDMDDYYRSLK